MDRRKSEAKIQLKKVEDECRSTVDLLNKLLETCSTQVDVLDAIDSKDYRVHSHHFLAVMQFQLQSFQKLMEINVDLEEHIELKKPPILEQFNLENEQPAKIDTLQLGVDLLNIKPNVPEKSNCEENKRQNQTCSETMSAASTPASVVDQATELSQKTVTKLCEIDTLQLGIDLLDTEHNVVEKSNCEENVKQNETGSNTAFTSAEQSTKIHEITNKVDTWLNAEYNVPEKSNHQETVKQNKSWSKKKAAFNTSTPVNIVEKLTEISKKTVTEKVAAKPMSNVMLQPCPKKMSDVSKENMIECGYTGSLTDVDRPSSEEDFVTPNSSIVDCIKERSDPKINDLCMIGHVESPSRFYIQVADENSSILDLLSDQLESLPINDCSNLTKPKAKQFLGNFCCVKIDDVWYRGEILDWMLNASRLRQEQVLIHLIDYGNILHTNYKELCPMLRELYDIPKMAQLCHLDGLYPPGSTHKNVIAKWPEESVDGFLNICGDLNSNIYRITHVSKDNKRNSFAIDIINTLETDEEHSIGQILLDANLVVELFDEPVVGNNTMIKQILKSHGLQNMKPNMTRDEILEVYFAENNVKEARNINEAVMDYDPRDEAKTCKNLRKDGTCYKGDRCTLRHVPLRDGFTRDKHPVYNRAFVDATMPSAGDEVLLTISHVCSLERFYAQIRDTDNIDVDKPTINSLITDMNKPETIKLYKNLRYPPGLSQLVIVRHWNSYWYRGQVRSVTIPEGVEDITAEVCVLDFGDTLIAPISDLRMMMPEFLTIPIQAVECRIYNIQHKNGCDEAEEKKYFESRYLGQTFRAKIIAVPGYLEVLLRTKDDDDLGEKFISDGYGEKRTEYNFPKSNEIYLID